MTEHASKHARKIDNFAKVVRETWRVEGFSSRAVEQALETHTSNVIKKITAAVDRNEQRLMGDLVRYLMENVTITIELDEQSDTGIGFAVRFIDEQSETIPIDSWAYLEEIGSYEKEFNSQEEIDELIAKVSGGIRKMCKVRNKTPDSD